jgi:Holliday junction resolvase RusA-like endonuclease
LLTHAEIGSYVLGKVQVDNLVKFTLDAIGGVVFGDDGQIAHLSCEKVWDNGDGSTTCVVSKLLE